MAFDLNSLVQLLGGAASIYGGVKAAQGSSQVANQQQQALAASRGVNFGPFNFTGLGGSGATFTPGVGGGFGLGAGLNGVNNQLTGLAGLFSGNAGAPGGGPGVDALSGFLKSLQGAGGANPLPGAPDTGALTNGASTAFQQALGGLQGITPGSTLANLRAQAAPQEQQQQQSLLDNQFKMGTLGTSGGALQTEAFARGLGQADLTRQTTATSLEDSLLNSAFSRFGQTANLASDLSNTGFNNALNLSNTGFGRTLSGATAGAGIAGQVAQLPLALQGTQLGLALQALQGTGGLQQQGLGLFQAGLAGNQSVANAALGSSQLTNSLVGNPNYAAGQLGPANILGQLGSVLQGGNSVTDILSKLFGNSGALPNGAANGAANYGDTLSGLNFNINGPGTDPRMIFNGAGGQAAIASGLQNLDFSSILNNPNMSNTELAKSLGVNPDLLTKDLSGGSFDLGSLFKGANSALDIYGGVSQGGTQGYGAALAGGSDIASLAGFGGTGTNVAGAIGNTASGNYVGAVKNLAGLVSGAGSGFGGAASGAAANSALADAGFGGSSAAGGGAAAGGGVAGAAAVALPAFLAQQLFTGLTAGRADERANLVSSSSAQASLTPVLFGPDGPGKYMLGTEGAVMMKDGTVLSPAQFNQLKQVYIDNQIKNVNHPGAATKAQAGLPQAVLDLIKQFTAQNKRAIS